MSKLYKNIFWGVLTLVVVSVLFSSLFSPGQATPEKLSLNQLADRVIAGEVKEITVQGGKLDIVLRDDKKAVSEKESEAGLSETLKNFGVSSEALSRVALKIENESGWQYWAGILVPTLLPVLIIGFFFWLMFRQARTGANQAFSFGRSNIRLSTKGKDKVTFKDVAGLKESKEELIEIVDFLKNPKKFLDMGARIPRGVLLVGPPGTGKTLLARAVAGEANVPFFHISASEFVEMFVGVGAARTRDAFDTAKRAAPSILFIDEIDAVGRQRGAGLGGGNDEREQTLNQILVELDGFDRDAKVIVLAATNRPDILDPALLRPGRFDRRVVLDLPDINDREAILKIHAKGKILEKDVDLRKVAVRTPGFSGADLANLLNEAAIFAARRNQKAIAQNDVYESIEKVILGPERRSRAITEKEKDITAYHEGGHALAAALLKNADPVHKVSIVSRGFAGGYTMKLPTEERHYRTKKQFLAELVVGVAGFAAEKLMLGDVSTGAASDLKEVSELARKIVTRYGMSEAMGPMTFGKTEELVFLGREITTERNYSEETAAKIDAEVNKLISYAHQAANKLLSANKKILAKIADTLKEKETLEQDEFYAILKPFRVKQVEL